MNFVTQWRTHIHLSKIGSAVLWERCKAVGRRFAILRCFVNRAPPPVKSHRGNPLKCLNHRQEEDPFRIQRYLSSPALTLAFAKNSRENRC